MKSATTNGDWLVLNDLYTSLKAFCIYGIHQYYEYWFCKYKNDKKTKIAGSEIDKISKMFK